MGKKSFEKEFPGYELIASKESKLKGPMIILGAIAGLVLLFAGLFWELSRLQVPIANVAGVNKATIITLENMATSQVYAGEYQAAADNFNKYFALGGKSADAMAHYAASLNELGQTEAALEWSRKAVEQDPTSKAAIFIKDTLEKKPTR